METELIVRQVPVPDLTHPVDDIEGQARFVVDFLLHCLEMEIVNVGLVHLARSLCVGENPLGAVLEGVLPQLVLRGTT